MKSLLLLWSTLASEEAKGCRTSATMDIKNVQGRVKHEGLSFLTITLANFGKDFEKSLDQGFVARSSFTGFRWKRGLPRFLGGFLELVFDRDSGRLLDEPRYDAILAVRQLTLMFSKIEVPCSDARIDDAFRGYIQCEKDVRASDANLSAIDLDAFKRVSGLLFARLYTDVDRKVYNGEIVPRHGPGATADRLIGNEKFRQSTWPARLNKVFPMWETLIPNHRFSDELEEIDILEPGAEVPVRVITVPKTQKGPRIIGIEPTAMQYMQQGLMHEINEGIRRDNLLRPFISAEDQTPNQRMAEEGSAKQNLATLDLSEASDRVSNQHVRALLHNHPHLHEGVDACRSRKADVPGHGVIRLAKFASMGSGLAFPMESMVFLTVIFMGIEEDLNRRLDRGTIKSYHGQVRVYGDDIIIPVHHVPSVISKLQTFGFVVNESKSFWTGRFRESCGKEYFAGQDVSIVKVRQPIPSSRTDATGVVSLISLRNQLYYAGLWDSVALLDGWIRKLIRHFPVVLPSSPVQGRHSFLGYETQRMDANLHTPLVKGYVIKAQIPKNSLDGSGALLKYLIRKAREDESYVPNQGGGLPSVGEDHLERSGRPQSVDIKLRWNKPY